MNTKFKRHQPVTLIRDPDPEYIEYSEEYDESKPPIKKGMKGKINLILSNGQYHVEILSQEGKTIAYLKTDEDSIEAD